MRAELTLKPESITGIYTNWLAGPCPLISVRVPRPITGRVVMAMILVVNPGIYLHLSV
jgi:hypothetical protein